MLRAGFIPSSWCDAGISTFAMPKDTDCFILDLIAVKLFYDFWTFRKVWFSAVRLSFLWPTEITYPCFLAFANEHFQSKL